MNDQSVKMSYGKVAVNLLIVSVLYLIMLIVLSVIIGAVLTILLNILTPFIGPELEGFIVVLQVSFLIFIIYFSLGVVSARANKVFIRNSTTALLIGAATGLSANALIIILFLVLDTLININQLGRHFSAASVIQLYEWILIFYGIVSIFSVPLAAWGSWCYERNSAKEDEDAGSRSVPRYVVGIAVILILILVAPIITINLIHLAGAATGDPYTLSSGGTPVFSTTRLDDDTILIVYDGLKPEPHPNNVIYEAFNMKSGVHYTFSRKEIRQFNIFINYKNASNSYAISQSGLNASIDPASGLGYAEGSCVKFTGRDITPKAYNPGYNGTEFWISTFSDGGKEWPVYGGLV